MSQSAQLILGLTILIAAPLSIFYYARVVGEVRRRGGQVTTAWVSSPDLVMILTLGGALVGLALEGFARATDPSAQLKAEQIGGGMAFLLVLGLGVLGFLAIRRIPLVETLGLKRVGVPTAVFRGGKMLLAGVPVLMLLGAVMVLLLKEQAQEQDLVKLFNSAAREGDVKTVLRIFLAGVVVAPLCEELLFRGYFYPVAKRFLGPAFGSLLAAALFSLLHTNLASSLSLMALALTFTVAYERTGSILVPMSMHALFNGANLLMLYVVSRAMPHAA